MSLKESNTEPRSGAPSFEIDRETIQRLGSKLIQALAGGWDTSTQRLFPSKTGDDLSKIIGVRAPENGISIDDLTDKVIGEVMPNMFNALQPHIYQLMASPLPAVSLLEVVSVYFNNQPYYTFNAQLQKTVLKWLGEMIGFASDAAGIFTKGGTTSNLYAIAIARTTVLGTAIRRTGMSGLPPLTVYVSEEAHTSIDKAIELLGIGSDYLRKIPVTSDFKIDLEILNETIRTDRKLGLKPFCLIANGGSARTGTVDPIESMADVAKTHRLWFHIDGAYGALAAMTVRGKVLFKGIELADSVSLDPHKWMNVPYESSCLLVKDWSSLYATFEHVPDYLGTLQPDEKKTFSSHFDFTQSDKALKVWYALQAYGVKNYRALFEHHLALAKDMVETLKKISAIEVFHEPELSICCFRYVPVDLSTKKVNYSFYLNNLNRSIELSLKENKNILITTTTIGKDVVLRVCIVSYRTQPHMIHTLIESICEVGQAMDRKMRSKKPVVILQ